MNIKQGGNVGMRGGSVTVMAKAHAALSKGQPVHLTCDSEGLLTAALTNISALVVVALADVASGDVGEFMKEGVCEVLVTADACVAGDGLLPDVSEARFVSGGAFDGVIGLDTVTDAGVSFDANGSAAGLVTAYLHGYPVTAQA